MFIPPPQASRRRRLRRQLVNQLQVPADQLRSIDRALRRRTRWRIMIPFIICNTIIMTAACVLLARNWTWIPAIRGLGTVIFVMSRMALITGVVFIYVRFVLIPFIERRRFSNLLAVLREHGYQVCPTCGYRWDGLKGDAIQCPECGVSAPRAPAPRAK